MRLFLITLVVLSSLSSFCQVDLFFSLEKEFDWSMVEKQNQEVKAKFIENKPKKLGYYRDDDNEYLSSIFTELETNLHIVDFNNDGLDDVIFHGHLGAESPFIVIFINTGNSFTEIFFDHQEIYKMVFKNGKVHRLYIKSGGCCCDYIEANKVYEVDYSSELPKIHLINQTQYVIEFYINRWGIDTSNKVEYPSKYFHKPVKFKVLNNKYNIRFSPTIKDIPEIQVCGEVSNGNSLGKIKAGSIGYALAEKTDSTGRIWWFVAMNPNTKFYKSLYYDDKKRPNSYKLGWISSRFVKEINEE